jgi:hypothetical protein
VTRTHARLIAALLSIAAIVAATIGLAAPASATPVPTISFSWQVLIGSTWTSIPLNPGVEIPVPAGSQQSRFIITNTSGAGQDATLSEAWFGSTNFNNTGTLGLQLTDCPGYTGTPLALPAGGSVTCTGTFNFIPGHRAVLYGFTAQFTVGGQYQFGNQGAFYNGISDATTETLQATNATSSLLDPSDPGLQTLPAGFVPAIGFNFSNSGASESLTSVTYSSTGTASIASACAGLATTWAVPGSAGSGQCVLQATHPASTTPQTVTVTAVGTGAFGPVTTTKSITYAASAATCTTSATTFNPGSSGTITCSGFQPGITVTATLHSSPIALGSTSTGTGAFTFAFTVPKSVPAGTHTISIDGGGIALATSDPFTVGVLAETGVNVAGPLGAGAALLALGGALVLYRRSRSARTR